jgi:hypothetical protein
MSQPDSWDEAVERIGCQPDWVITNPPFNVAHKILPLALEHCNKGVIALLRLTYLESCKNRASWLRRYQDNLSILFLPRRVSFTGDGRTDSACTAWFIWGKDGRICEPFVYPTVEIKQLELTS